MNVWEARLLARNQKTQWSVKVKLVRTHHYEQQNMTQFNASAYYDGFGEKFQPPRKSLFTNTMGGSTRLMIREGGGG